LNSAASAFLWYKATHDWTGMSRPREVLRKFNAFNVRRLGDHFAATVLGAEMMFTMYHLSNVVNELDSWEEEYLPTSVKGKAVLSVGDGCGETSLFFLRHGASRVIAVEKDPESFGLLCKNVENNHLNVAPINDSFRLEHLKMDFDFVKIDVEGDERVLLELDPGGLKPCILEAHRFTDKNLPEKLQSRFNMRRVSAIGRRAVLLTNVN
jgi:Met-10+ like-protein